MENDKNIFIIGAGAIGLVLGVKLIRQGKNVTLIKIRSTNLSENIIPVAVKENNETIIKTRVPIQTMEYLKNKSGLLIITSKAFVNTNIAKSLKEYDVQGPIVLLQNGLGVEQPYIDENFSGIYRCVLFTTSMKISEYEVQYKPVAPSPVGIVKGSIDQLHSIVEMLSTSSFEFISQPEIESTVWEKATINAVFNSICPLLDIDNGIFYRDPEVRSFALEIIQECITVAASQHVQLDQEKILTKVLSISKSSDGQLISTLQDIKARNQTEIAYLNLEIANLASTSIPQLQVNKTKLLGELISLKSKLALKI